MAFSFGMDFGSLLGAGIGAIASNASAKKQFKYQSALQQQAYNLTQQGYREAPKNQRKGLEDAGYNPMLAVQNGVAGANATFSAGQASAPDYAGGLSAGVQNALNIQGMKNQTKQTEATTDEAYANADKAKAEKATILQRLPFISQREKSEIANIEKDSMKKEAEIHNIDETTRFIEKNYELQKRLGEMGLDVQRYGIDKNLQGVIFNARTNEENNKRTNRVNTSIENIRHPFSGFARKAYTSGKDYKGSYKYSSSW